MCTLLCLGCRGLDSRAGDSSDSVTRAEKRCIDAGWRRVSFDVSGIRRKLLWKGPEATWRHGAILVMHGGGGRASDFCSAGWLLRPQVRFASLALERGFAVFLLESTEDAVTDAQGLHCGKRFDYMPLERANLDLPYIERVIDQVVEPARTPASSSAVFLTGLSIGGYMTTRAATTLGGDEITAFAPISSGDPYGTSSNCDASLSPRKVAKGVLFDNETELVITREGACRAPSAASAQAHESPWPSPPSARKPAFMQFHHLGDGIVDRSCMEKAGEMLRSRGYPDRGAFLLSPPGRRTVWKHLWQSEYNAPLLDFFENEARVQASSAESPSE